MVSRLTCIAAGSMFLAAAAVACGGKVATDDLDPGSTRAQKPDGDRSDAAKAERTKPSPPIGSAPPPGPPPVPSTSCSLNGGSASGGISNDGVMTCQSEVSYTCADRGEVTLTCYCGPSGPDAGFAEGSCKCAGHVFPFDCSKGCGLGLEEHAQCKLPFDSGSSSGGSSSSGG